MGEGFCGNSIEQQFTKFTYPLPGPLRGEDVLPLRRLVPLHDDRHQQVGADVPEPQAGVRGQPGLLVEHRDQAGRRHPAGLHQPGARRHRRVGQLRRLLPARLGQRQPPRDRLPAEVRRAGGRVQGRLRHLRRAGRAAGRRGGVHRGQHLRGLDQEDVRLVGPARSTSTTRTSRRRATSSSRRSRTTSRRPRCAGSPRAGPATRPTPATPSGAPTRPTSWRPSAARSSSSRRACWRTRPTTTSGSPLPHVHPQLGGARRRSCSAKYPLQLISPHPRFSFHTQHDTHVPWLSEIPGHRTCDRRLRLPGRAACTPTDAAGQRHQARRRGQAVQRPRLGAAGRPGDRAGEAGRGALVRGRVQVRPDRARQGRQHRQGRLRQPAHPVAG